MIKYFVDSGSDLTAKELDKFDIGLLPFSIIIHGKEYLSDLRWQDIDPGYLIRVLQAGVRPVLNRPSIDEWYNRLKPAVEAGYDIVYLSMSSQVTKALEQFTIVENMLKAEGILREDQRFEGIDTGLCSLALKAYILSVVQNKNISLEEFKLRCRNYIILGSPKWLQSSGRVEMGDIDGYVLAESDLKHNQLFNPLKVYPDHQQALDALANLIPYRSQGYIGISTKVPEMQTILGRLKNWSYQMVSPTNTAIFGPGMLEVLWLDNSF